jgi:hypothetical protein
MIDRPENVLLIENPVLDNRAITWIVNADNAQQKRGIIKLNEIPVYDKSK